MAEHSPPGNDRSPPGSAVDQIAAAERLVADPELGPPLARSHLRRAWELVHEEADGDEDLLSWSGAEVERRASKDERDAVDRVRRWALSDDAEDDVPDEAELFVHTALLRVIAGGQPKSRPWFAIAGAGFVAAMLMLMVLSAVVSVVRGPVGPWLGEWYDNQDFEGEPYLQRARKIEFNWDREPPRVPGIPADRFSVIWRTCIVADEETEIRFRVSSDDGARLYVDGEKIVDNWGAHAVRTRTGKTTLSPGAHYLRVDFFEASATAEIKVLAAIGDSKEYESIPIDMLFQPGSGDDPCG